MEAAKSAGWFALWVVVVAVIFFVLALLVRGAAEISAIAMPWLFAISRWALGISVVALLPLSFFRGTRGFSAIGFLIGSYAFGLCAWVLGFLVTYSLWGFIGVAIGVLIMGVGVVPVAIVASIFDGSWDYIWEILILLLMLFSSRVYAMYLAEKADREAYERQVLTSEIV